MKVKVAYSVKSEIDDIINDLKIQIGNFESRLVQFFTTSQIDSAELARRIHQMFYNVPTFGCTTAGEIVTGKMLDNSVVLMAYGPEIVEDCAIAVMENITDNKPHVERAFKSFEKYFKQAMADLDPQKYVGIVLIDGLCALEEKINERIGDLTNVIFIGGSAGDDFQFKQTLVFANGKSYSNAVLLTLIKSRAKFEFLKTQSFKSTNKEVEITKADESTRTVYEINNKPALQEYADQLGTNVTEVRKYFQNHPLGLGFDNNFFVRSPFRVQDEGIIFSCAIKEKMRLEILRSLDIVSITQRDLDEKHKQMGTISALLCFNCVLRKLEIVENNQKEAYGQIFKDIPTIGFSTYGESYIGHINQTAVMLLFK